ncbi:MAG: hypothetical protein V3U87_09465 [Methylococcaceae bacterium]
MIRFFVFVFMLSSQLCYAESSELEQKILKQATNEMEIVTKTFRRTLDKCNKIADNKIFDLSKFKDILFDDLRFSLLYLSRKATDNCSLEEWKNYAFALIKLKRVYEQYEKTPPDQVSNLVTIHFNARQDMELESKYKNIPSKYRTILDNIDELKTPFRVTKLVEQIEKMHYPKHK